MSEADQLRTAVEDIAVSPRKLGAITDASLPGDLVRSTMLATGEIIGLHRKGAVALQLFTKTIWDNSLELRRATTFKDLRDKVFHVVIEKYLESNPPPLDAITVDYMKSTVEAWAFADTESRELLIPCAITRSGGSQPFMVGPIRFRPLDDFLRDTQGQFDPFLVKDQFERLLDQMKHRLCTWMATVTINKSKEDRAWELGALATDLALAGIQLLTLREGADNISRMTARATPGHLILISSERVGQTNLEPGRLFGPGFLDSTIAKGARVISSVGSRINAFLSQTGSTPTLDQAWCDAAYWFHEGLAEPLDTIAVTKLETAIEVLFKAESSSRGTQRLLKALGIFYGLASDDPINPDTVMTAKQFAAGLVTDRSRILHGTWSTLDANLEASRTSLALVSRNLLVQYTLALDDYASRAGADDDQDAFLVWVKQQRDARKNAPSR